MCPQLVLNFKKYIILVTGQSLQKHTVLRRRARTLPHTGPPSLELLQPLHKGRLQLGHLPLVLLRTVCCAGGQLVLRLGYIFFRGLRRQQLLRRVLTPLHASLQPVLEVAKRYLHRLLSDMHFLLACGAAAGEERKQRGSGHVSTAAAVEGSLPQNH